MSNKPKPLSLPERLASAQVRNAFKVAHLEDSRRDYYLVPIFSDADQPYFVAQVSAHTGTILSMEGIRSVVPESESWLYAALSEDEVEAQLAACSKEYIPRSWQSTGRLVWRHCLQSQSPYEPFHEVRRGEEIAWLDVHGKLHQKLDYPRRRDSGPRPENLQ